jgi:hypothetical protein
MEQRMRPTFLAVLLFSPSLTIASAQSIQVQQASLFIQPMDGEPRLCGAEFTVVYLDRYKQGGIGAVNGSLSLTHKAGDVVVRLVFTASDFPAGQAKPGEPFDVTSVTLANGEEVMKASEQVALPPARATFATAFYLPDSTSILSALQEDTLSLRFNRAIGGQEYRVPISLAQNLTNGQDAGAYEACVKTVLGKGMEEMKSAAGQK